jgi:hypothetical protein
MARMLGQVRRAFMLLACVGCARILPAALTADPSPDPLVIGRSPATTPTEQPADASAVVATWMLPHTNDGAAVWTGCHLVGSGSARAAAASLDIGCVVEQEYDRHNFDSGAPILGIWGSSPASSGVPVIRLAIFRKARPVVGVLPMTSFNGHARIELDTRTWLAENEAPVGTIFAGSTMGNSQSH